MDLQTSKKLRQSGHRYMESKYPQNRVKQNSVTQLLL